MHYEQLVMDSVSKVYPDKNIVVMRQWDAIWGRVIQNSTGRVIIYPSLMDVPKGITVSTREGAEVVRI